MKGNFATKKFVNQLSKFLSPCPMDYFSKLANILFLSSFLSSFFRPPHWDVPSVSFFPRRGICRIFLEGVIYMFFFLAIFLNYSGITSSLVEDQVSRLLQTLDPPFRKGEGSLDYIYVVLYTSLKGTRRRLQAPIHFSP